MSRPVLSVITPTGDVDGSRHQWLTELSGAVADLQGLLGLPIEHLGPEVEHVGRAYVGRVGE